MQTWAKWSARRVDLAIFPLCISRCVSTIATLVLQICFSVAAEKRFSWFSRKKSTISCGWQGYKAAAKPVIDRKDAVLAIE